MTRGSPNNLSLLVRVLLDARLPECAFRSLGARAHVRGASCSVHCVPLEISEWELPTDMSLHMVPLQGKLRFLFN